MKKQIFSIAALFIMILLALGSTDRPSPNYSNPTYTSRPSYSPPPPTAKEDAFRTDVGGMPTPFGAIDTSTVKEGPNNTMSYKTADGRTWEVTMERDEEGRYHYSEPQEK